MIIRGSDMKNVQISFDENLLESVDRIAAKSGTSRSAIVREAIRQWVWQKGIRDFEREWINKLKERPDKYEHSDEWMKIQKWGD